MMLVAEPGENETLIWRLIGTAISAVAVSCARRAALKRRPSSSIISGVSGIASFIARCATGLTSAEPPHGTAGGSPVAALFDVCAKPADDISHVNMNTSGPHR